MLATTDAQTLVCSEEPGIITNSEKPLTATASSQKRDWVLLQELKLRQRFSVRLSDDKANLELVKPNKRSPSRSSRTQWVRHENGTVFPATEPDLSQRLVFRQVSPRDAAQHIVITRDVITDSRAVPKYKLEYRSQKPDPFGTSASANSTFYTCMDSDDLERVAIELPDSVECRSENLPNPIRALADDLTNSLYWCETTTKLN